MVRLLLQAELWLIDAAMDRPQPVADDHFESEPQLLAPSFAISRKPSRREQLTHNEINPLLANLSPSSTLEALAATGAVSVEEKDRWSSLENSVALASTSERAWAIKVSLARQKLIKWHEELSNWPWSHKYPSGFEEPLPAHRLRTSEEEFWGGIPARVVLHYEERVEAIRDDMETLEVENLKNYVRNMFHGGRYEPLSDLTSLMTEEIVQSLPTLSRLNSLLRDWSNRLLILRQTPTFLRDMDASDKSMASAWKAIVKPDESVTLTKLDLTQEVFLQIRADLQDRIARLARQVDNMLDLDEKDELPPRWASRMDELEKDYSAWVVEAGELVLNTEMNTQIMDLQAGQSNLSIQSHVNALSEVSEHRLPIATNAHLLHSKEVVNSGSNHPGQHPSNDGYNDELDDKAPSDKREHVRVPAGGAPPGANETMPLEQGVGQSSDPHLEMNAIVAPDPPKSSVLSHLQTSMPTEPRLYDRSEFGLMDSPDTGHSQGNRSHDNSFEPTTSPSLSQRRANRPSPLVLEKLPNPESTTWSEMSSDISSAGSATSDYFSNKSSPEILDASVVEYIGSPVLKSPLWASNEPITPLDIVSRHSSQRTERGDSKFPQRGSWSGFASPVSQRSRASTFVPERTVVEAEEPAKAEHAHPWKPTHVRTRSASMQSIEVVPKSEIRKIVVRRSESYSSPPGTSRLIPALTSQQLQGNASTEDAVPGPEAQPEEADKHDSDSSDPITLPKARHRFEQVSDLGPGSTPVSILQKSSVDTSNSNPTTSKAVGFGHKPSQSVDDQLEARISSILTSIPAHIRLTSGPEPDAPEVTHINPFSGPKAPAARQPAARLNRALTSTPTMTLAPAQPKTSRTRSQNGEPEIKLYHLHQAGKDVPIKLFVRLVGENGERVMVRIGGGWADLGEYLKEYATHHGRRAVSDSRFDIQGLPSSPLASQTSPSSRPVTPSSGASSAIGFKRHQAVSGQFERPHTPVSDPQIRPASRSSWTEEDSPSLGLAGPKTKKVDISPRKQAWVEEMLDQARQGGDVGKVGATKRVFLKSKLEGQ